MVWDQSFLGEDDENPYSHLNEFEQTYACLRIVGMLDETLRWKLFPNSLTRKLNVGTISPLRVDKEIGKPCGLAFACNSFTSLG